MASIKFLLQSEKNPANIYVRLVDGRKVDIKTKTNFVINPADWSASKQKPKNLKNPDLKNLDVDLQELKVNLINHYNNSNEKIDLLWLKDFINPRPRNDINVPTDLVGYIEFYKEMRIHETSEAMRKKVNLIKAKMERMQKHRNRTILIKEIDENFKNEFVKYCKSQNYSQNTMQRELVFIKTFCKHAKSKGIEVSLELDGLRLDRAKSTFVYLSFEEIDALQELGPGKLTESLINARDWLVISCYTAQRISDFMRFTPEMIREQGGKKLIEFRQVKTGKLVTLPLHSKVIEILDKRNGQFPYAISEQKYNDYIKDVCEIAEFTQKVSGSLNTEIKKGVFRKVSGMYRKCDLVSSHIGRRSFATNFYGKIPTSLLISATGHGTEEMFLAYIGKSNSDKAMELSKYF